METKITLLLGHDLTFQVMLLPLYSSPKNGIFALKFKLLHHNFYDEVIAALVSWRKRKIYLICIGR